MKSKLCKECGQPMLPPGEKRRTSSHYRHAKGCPLDDWKPTPGVRKPNESPDAEGRG
jgi:hypothetical protein